MATVSLCSIPGCDKPVRVKSRGWCNAHWLRWSRYGDPVAGGVMRDTAYRYLRDVVLPYNDKDECLFWPFNKTSDGYGRIGIGGERVAVHRHVCEEVDGPPPTEKHEAAHSCGNGHLACVNPHHLSWKTRAENFADKLSHGTHNRGERNGYAKLTEEVVREIKALKGKMSQRDIARRFGASQQQVSKIQRGDSWSWL